MGIGHVDADGPGKNGEGWRDGEDSEEWQELRENVEGWSGGVEIGMGNMKR